MKKELQNKSKIMKLIFPIIIIIISALILGYIKSYINITVLCLCVIGILILIFILYYKGIITLNKNKEEKHVVKKKTNGKTDKKNKMNSSTDLPVYKGKSSENQD